MLAPGWTAPTLLIPQRGRIFATCSSCGDQISVPLVRATWIRHPAGTVGGYQIDPTTQWELSGWLAAHRGPVRAFGVLTG